MGSARVNTVYLSQNTVHFSRLLMRISLQYKILLCAILDAEEAYVTGIEANLNYSPG